MIEKAIRVLKEKQELVASLRAAETAMIKECKETKSVLPAGYWQDRFTAEKQLESAQKLVDLLK